MKKIKRYFLLKRYKLKDVLKKEWLAAGVHMKDKKLPPVWDEDGKYLSIDIGDILPMFELPGGKFAYYEVVKSHYKYGDWLYDTDAYSYDMKFSHIGEYKIRWNEE